MPADYKYNKSNFEHSFWQDRIAEHFGKECKTKIERVVEKDDTKKKIDVALEHDGRLLAIEIAMTDAYERHNIEKDLKVGCSKVIIACRNKTVLAKVNSIIKDLKLENSDKVKALLLAEITKLSLKEL